MSLCLSIVSQIRWPQPLNILSPAISLSFLVFHTYGATKYNWIRASNTYYHSITLTADLLKLNPLCEVAGRSVNQSVSQSLSLSPPTTNLPPNELKECPHLQLKPSAMGWTDPSAHDRTTYRPVLLRPTFNSLSLHSPSKAPISLHSNAAAPNDLQCDFAPWKPDNNSVSLELLSFLSPSILVWPILIVYRVIQ